MRRALDRERDSFAIMQWKFDPDWDEPDKVLEAKDSCPVLRGDLDVNSEPAEAELNNRTIVSLKSATLRGGREVLLLHHQSAYRTASKTQVLSLGDHDSASEALGAPLDFPGRTTFLECAQGDRALVRDETSRAFLFVDLDARRVAATYAFRDLCLDAGHEHESSARFALPCVYEAKMDLNPGRKEFALFSQNLSCYQLFSYEDDPDEPEVVASGGTMVHTLPFKMLPREGRKEEEEEGGHYGHWLGKGKFVNA